MFQKAFQNLSEQDEAALRKEVRADNKLSGLILLNLLVIVPITFLTIGIGSSFIHGPTYIALLISAGLSAFIAILGVATIEIKKKLGPYSRNGLPICLSMIWAFVAFPFFVLLPTATILTGRQ